MAVAGAFKAELKTLEHYKKEYLDTRSSVESTEHFKKAEKDYKSAEEALSKKKLPGGYNEFVKLLEKAGFMKYYNLVDAKISAHNSFLKLNSESQKEVSELFKKYFDPEEVKLVGIYSLSYKKVREKLEKIELKNDVERCSSIILYIHARCLEQELQGLEYLKDSIIALYKQSENEPAEAEMFKKEAKRIVIDFFENKKSIDISEYEAPLFAGIEEGRAHLFVHPHEKTLGGQFLRALELIGYRPIDWGRYIAGTYSEVERRHLSEDNVLVQGPDNQFSFEDGTQHSAEKIAKGFGKYLYNPKSEEKPGVFYSELGSGFSMPRFVEWKIDTKGRVVADILPRGKEYVDAIHFLSKYSLALQHKYSGYMIDNVIQLAYKLAVKHAFRASTIAARKDPSLFYTALNDSVRVLQTIDKTIEWSDKRNCKKLVEHMLRGIEKLCASGWRGDEIKDANFLYEAKIFDYYPDKLANLSKEELSELSEFLKAPSDKAKINKFTEALQRVGFRKEEAERLMSNLVLLRAKAVQYDVEHLFREQPEQELKYKSKELAMVGDLVVGNPKRKTITWDSSDEDIEKSLDAIVKRWPIFGTIKMPLQVEGKYDVQSGSVVADVATDFNFGELNSDFFKSRFEGDDPISVSMRTQYWYWPLFEKIPTANYAHHIETKLTLGNIIEKKKLLDDAEAKRKEAKALMLEAVARPRKDLEKKAEKLEKDAEALEREAMFLGRATLPFQALMELPATVLVSIRSGPFANENVISKEFKIIPRYFHTIELARGERLVAIGATGTAVELAGVREQYGIESGLWNAFIDSSHGDNFVQYSSNLRAVLSVLPSSALKERAAVTFTPAERTLINSFIEGKDPNLRYATPELLDALIKTKFGYQVFTGDRMTYSVETLTGYNLSEIHIFEHPKWGTVGLIGGFRSESAIVNDKVVDTVNLGAAGLSYSIKVPIVEGTRFWTKAVWTMNSKILRELGNMPSLTEFMVEKSLPAFNHTMNGIFDVFDGKILQGLSRMAVAQIPDIISFDGTSLAVGTLMVGKKWVEVEMTPIVKGLEMGLERVPWYLGGFVKWPYRWIGLPKANQATVVYETLTQEEKRFSKEAVRHLLTCFEEIGKHTLRPGGYFKGKDTLHKLVLRAAYPWAVFGLGVGNYGKLDLKNPDYAEMSGYLQFGRVRIGGTLGVTDLQGARVPVGRILISLPFGGPETGEKRKSKGAAERKTK